MVAPIGLQPTAELADRVLLPGDPGRALLLAETLIDGARMFNHHRGLWGYTGCALDGEPLTIQSTGMGGPSAAIVIHELIELGARRLLRIGTCGALQTTLHLGDLVIATEAIAADGTSQALGAGERVPATQELLGAVEDATGAVEDATGAVDDTTGAVDASHAVHRGPVVSTDLFYDRRALELGWQASGALAVEMEAATLFALAALHDVEAAALFTVSDLVLPERVRIGPEELQSAERRMGQAALRALGLEARTQP
jgi:DeoD family purine-nucleoside phosphorylase